MDINNKLILKEFTVECFQCSDVRYAVKPHISTRLPDTGNEMPGVEPITGIDAPITKIIRQSDIQYVACGGMHVDDPREFRAILSCLHATGWDIKTNSLLKV